MPGTGEGLTIITDYTDTDWDIIQFGSDWPVAVNSLVTSRNNDDLIIVSPNSAIDTNTTVLENFFVDFSGSKNVFIYPNTSVYTEITFDASGQIIRVLAPPNGGGEDDTLVGTNTADFIDGGDGNDTISGLDGKDKLDGGTGDDFLRGGLGDDLLIGGFGNDRIIGGGGKDTIIAGQGAGDDDYDGEEDVDTIRYESTTRGVTVNLLNGTGDGVEVDHDTITNIENVTGGSGNDIITGNNVDNVLSGGAGDDTYIISISSGGYDTVIDASGANKVVLSDITNANRIRVTRNGDNVILTDTITSNNVTIQGWFAAVGSTIALELQQIDALYSADQVSAAANGDGVLPLLNGPPVAQDDVFSGNYNTAISGNVLANDSDPDGNAFSAWAQAFTTANNAAVSIEADGSFTYAPPADFVGADSFEYSISDGNGGTDTATVTLNVAAPAGAIVGTASNDTLVGTVRANKIFGLAGDDTIRTGNGNDAAYGGTGDDKLYGGNGSDHLDGGAGDDTLYGGNGPDILTGGTGNDILYGGNGGDTFVLNATDVGNGVDTIKDFSVKTDRLDLSDIFSGANPLDALLSSFVKIEKSGSNSVLSVDVDGVGTDHGFTQVATLTGVTAGKGVTLVIDADVMVKTDIV